MEKGVEVYFEKENIYTLDSKGELLITIKQWDTPLKYSKALQLLCLQGFQFAIKYNR